jgi:hypothetical protein
MFAPTIRCWLLPLATMLFWFQILPAAGRGGEAHLNYTHELTVIRGGWDGHKSYVHSRAGAIPPEAPGNPTSTPIVVLTTQKHPHHGNDIFDGLEEFRTDDLGATWDGPQVQPTLDRRQMGPELIAAPCDFTPQWHAASGKLLGTGKTFWYRHNDQYGRSPSDTIYAVYDPKSRAWSEWRRVEFPDEPKFQNCSAGCTQRYDLPNGDVLLPVYMKPELGNDHHITTVVHCKFDGQTLRYERHGDELKLPQGRGIGDGLTEPSLTKFGDRFYLTMRTMKGACVAAGDDGLQFEPSRPWQFDDGQELGSYNTQQHWVTHSDGLYLVYTRRGADNDHIFRHRAPHGTAVLRYGRTRGGAR